MSSRKAHLEIDCRNNPCQYRGVKTFKLIFFILSSLSFLTSTISKADETKSASSGSQKVLWVPFEGTVELGLSPYIVRAVQYAEDNQFDAIVLDVDTFGGRVDAAVEIRDALIDSPMMTVAWVNKRAISAGALISLACKKIFFTPGSTMGAATPIQGGAEGAKDAGKKYVSYFRGEMGATAERNGRSRKLAEAMVQATEDIKGLVKEGEVLTLTDVTALENKMSDGTVSSREELLKSINLENAQVEVFGINWAERIVRFITDPTVSGLLMSGGVLGIILELQSPGFGLPGIIGITCFAVFFFGKFLVNLAGFEEVLLLILGLVLVFLEFFVFPGTFIFAIAGFAIIIGALFFSGISPKVPLDFSFPNVTEHIQAMSTGMLSFIVGLIIILWYFSKNPRAVPLSLKRSLVAGDGTSKLEQDEWQGMLKRSGILLTDLRPSGKLELNGRVYQVVSSGEFLERGQEVEVVEANSSRIVVRSKRNSS